jgi:hypothetical protein
LKVVSWFVCRRRISGVTAKYGHVVEFEVYGFTFV